MLIPDWEDPSHASPYMRVCVDDFVAPMHGDTCMAPVTAHLLSRAA